ncbi:hypothetical protein N7492_004567 [Penicillium capsulatum]|uniref:Cytochrome P450 n=1 Tax=Penicillium capsulatum TaxID=69766 RepID=A0A9W9I7V5_9EURO|nr:hypothetical protein N7492_004567 [Penicillium capsulatum]KAJ6136315.1 hypothetical protein N7512_001475 [Penicillium capsulatum]
MSAGIDMISSPLGIALLTVLAYPIGRIVYNAYFHPLAHLPGPRTWAATRLPFVWALLRGTIVHDFQRLHQKYGPIVRTAPDEVSFADGDAWTDIYANRHESRQFLKDPIWWKRQPGEPDSLLSAISPPGHARMRKLLAPAFSPRALRAQEPVLQKYTTLLVDRIRQRVVDSGDEANINLTPWLNYTTFDIFGDLGFGESFDCLQDSRYHPWIDLLFKSVKAASVVAATRYYPLLDFLLKKCIPASLMQKAQRHRQQIVEKIDRRLSWEVQRPDIMSHLIDDDGQVAWSRGELDATFGILTTVGSETTATALMGIMCYLVNYPEKLAIVSEEVRTTFKDSIEIKMSLAKDLPYLNAVIYEGLRMCPPVPWMLPRRVPDGGDTVCGVWLPARTPVSLQTYSLNRDSKRFYKANKFLPERWLPDASTNPKSPFYNDDRRAVQPFSIGPRACLGQHLAWAEMQLILAKLLVTFDFQIVDRGMKWEGLRTFLLVEKKPLDVRVSLAT